MRIPPRRLVLSLVAVLVMLARATSPQTVAARPSPPVPDTYFVRLVPTIQDEKVTAAAHALARTYGGRIRLINLRGFHVEMSAESARALTWDERVGMVARYPRETPPAGKFAGSATHGERAYRVRLADSGRRYDQARVVGIGMELATRYQATLASAFAPSVGRPWLVLKARPPMARALSRDERVAWVAEEGTPAAAVSPEVSLKPLPRGPTKPPERAAKKGALEPTRGTLQRGSRHFRDWYFIVLDPARADVSSAGSITALADEIATAAGMLRTGGEFLRPPQGFHATGTEEAATRAAADPRVMWVEEVGSYLRTPEPVKGAYQVVLRKSLFGNAGDRDSVQRVAEELVGKYGGRVDLRFVWHAGPVGFALEDASEESALALSEDPRVEYVEERPTLHGSVPTPDHY